MRRASARFVRCASTFDAEIRVTRGRARGCAALDAMGLMMLAAGQGHTILIETGWSGHTAAMKALIGLVESGFGEED